MDINKLSGQAKEGLSIRTNNTPASQFQALGEMQQEFFDENTNEIYCALTITVIGKEDRKDVKIQCCGTQYDQQAMLEILKEHMDKVQREVNSN